jgi:hypothetical protein
MARTRQPTWSRPSEAAIMFLRGCTIRTAAPIALVVGTLLSAVNQSGVIADAHVSAATWLRIAFNYAVPFAVSSLGYLSARHVSRDRTHDNTPVLGTDASPMGK